MQYTGGGGGGGGGVEAGKWGSLLRTFPHER